MTEHAERLTRKEAPPDRADLSDWLGPEADRLWQTFASRIEAVYPGVFAPDWIFGGQKHGWGLRYRKSKAFCTFVPARGVFSVALVFGRAEREKMEGLLGGLDARFRDIYKAAPTYHDGKWLLYDIRCEVDIDDVMMALETKRRPKRPAC